MTTKPSQSKAKKQILGKSLLPEAERLLEESVLDYKEEVSIQAKLIAHGQGLNIVDKKHIEKAIERARGLQKKKWFPQFMVMVGSAFFGAFIPGFVTELQTPTVRVVWVSIYVALGFIGIAFVIWGYFQEEKE